MIINPLRTLLPLLAAFLLAFSSLATAETNSPLVLTIKNQVFTPISLTIPANVRVKIIVDNQDALPAEVESHEVGIEKVIPGATKLPLYVGPFKAGTYSFFNEFHPSSTGKLIVVEQK